MYRKRNIKYVFLTIDQKRLYARNNSVVQTAEVFHYNARRMKSQHSSAEETFVKRRSIQTKQRKWGGPASRQGPKPLLYSSNNTAISSVHAGTVGGLEVCWYNTDTVNIPWCPCRCICGIYIYICLYGPRFQQSVAQPGMVPNPARGQLKMEARVFPYPPSRLKI